MGVGQHLSVGGWHTHLQKAENRKLKGQGYENERNQTAGLVGEFIRRGTPADLQRHGIAARGEAESGGWRSPGGRQMGKRDRVFHQGAPDEREPYGPTS